MKLALNDSSPSSLWRKTCFLIRIIPVTTDNQIATEMPCFFISEE